MRPRILKFGGTSVADADRMRRVGALVQAALPAAPVVVLSATAGTTNSLLTAAEAAERGDVAGALLDVRALGERHRTLAHDLLGPSSTLDADIDGFVHEIEMLVRGIGLLRELSPRSRDAVASFGERSVNVETDPEGAGNVTLTLSSRSLAALLAGDVTAEALSASGRLRSSERLLRVNGASVQRPSWVGLQAPDSEVARSALGYLLSPLTLATLLSPQPALPRWPGRWLGEHAQP